MRSKRITPRSPLSVAFLVLAFAAAPAVALIMVQKGNQPVPDAGWPLGALEVANLPCRIGWWEGPPFGGGQRQFEYCGDTAEFQQALDAFARIRGPVRELVVEDGPHTSFILRDSDGDAENSRIDWTFTIWNPERFHRLFNNPKSNFDADSPHFRQPVDPPRLVVYVGGGQVEWDKVKVPAGLKVIDRRAVAAGVKPEGGALIRGHVYDMATGKPIAGATLTVRRAVPPEKLRDRDPAKLTDADRWETAATGATFEDGGFEIRKVPAGSCRLVAAAPGCAPRLFAYEQLLVHSFREYPDVQVVAQARATGVIRDEAGKPLAGIKVYPSSTMGLDGRSYSSAPSLETTTDAQGRFELAGLPVGYTYLVCHSPTHHRTWSDHLYALPALDLDIRMTATGTIVGRVVSADGKALAGDVHVKIDGEDPANRWGGSTSLRPDGTFQFTNVPPGKYRLSANPRALRATEDPNGKTVEVVAGKTVEAELVRGVKGF